jgi:hypothetical protein
MPEVDAGGWEVDDQGSCWRDEVVGVVDPGFILVLRSIKKRVSGETTAMVIRL